MKGYILVISTMLLFVTHVFAADSLKRDPFQQPNLLAMTTTKDEAVTSSRDSSQLVLKGTLRSKMGSLANVNGKILAIGELVNGFKLIAVSEQLATLVRGEERLELVLEGNTDNGRDQQ